MKQHGTKTTRKSAKWVKLWNMCSSYLYFCYLINQNCQIWKRQKKGLKNLDAITLISLIFLFRMPCTSLASVDFPWCCTNNLQIFEEVPCEKYRGMICWFWCPRERSSCFSTVSVSCAHTVLHAVLIANSNLTI